MTPWDAVKAGEVEALRAELAADPSLAHARRDGHRTLLHVLTDWPGHLPRATETPLHWAASADDVALIDGLLDAGADTRHS